MRVLVVEDEEFLAEAIRAGLRREAIAADIVYDGESALENVRLNHYDAIVLDRDLPTISGDEVCRRLAASGDGPSILMLTAARRLEQKVAGFELGADDYLAKPFEFPELVARLRALSRRSTVSRPPSIIVGSLRLDQFARQVYRGERYIPLTRKEFAVLEVLMRSSGGVISAEQLLEQAWDENANPFTNAIRVTISTLRKKLGKPWVIETVPGVGYRIQDGTDE